MEVFIVVCTEYGVDWECTENIDIFRTRAEAEALIAEEKSKKPFKGVVDREFWIDDTLTLD